WHGVDRGGRARRRCVLRLLFAEGGRGLAGLSTDARILLVEDDRSLRGAILGALAGAGYAASAVPDGIQAVQRLEAEQFELVLLDLGLPFIDGWRILAGLEGKLLPSVIVISARGEERDKVRALDSGADDY